MNANRSLGLWAGKLIEAEGDAPRLGAGSGVSHVRSVRDIRTVSHILRSNCSEHPLDLEARPYLCPCSSAAMEHL